MNKLKVLGAPMYQVILASNGQLGFNSDPLMVSKIHNEIHGPKGQGNKIDIMQAQKLDF